MEDNFKNKLIRRRLEKPIVVARELKEKEYNPENPAGQVSDIILRKVLNLPIGPHNPLMTIPKGENEQQVKKPKEYFRISPELDKICSQQFNNLQTIIKDYGKLGKILTQNPLEKHKLIAGIEHVDRLMERVKEDLEEFRATIQQARKKLTQQKNQKQITDAIYQKSINILREAESIYQILIQELQLKKRAIKWMEGGEVEGRWVDVKDNEKIKKKLFNTDLKINYFPNGHFQVVRGCIHNSLWQENFGDNRFQEFGLADIYASLAKYVAIEGSIRERQGESLQKHYSKFAEEAYDRLMKELLKAGFSGWFLEIDGRFEGEQKEKTFDNKGDLDDRDAERIFYFMQRINPDLAWEIGDNKTFIKIHSRLQTNYAINSKNQHLIQGEIWHDGVVSVKKVDNELKDFYQPTGLEVSQMAFSDALSALRMHFFYKLMDEGKIEPGLMVDFQGAGHLPLKKYYFHHPQEALITVLSNVWGVLPHFEELRNTDDILDRMENLTAGDWERIFKFIGTISVGQVVEPTFFKRGVESDLFRRVFQRPMNKKPDLNVFDYISEKEKGELRRAIKILTRQVAK